MLDLFTVKANGRLFTMIEDTKCRRFYRGPIFPATRSPNGSCGTGGSYGEFGSGSFPRKRLLSTGTSHTAWWLSVTGATAVMLLRMNRLWYDPCFALGQTDGGTRLALCSK